MTHHFLSGAEKVLQLVLVGALHRPCGPRPAGTYGAELVGALERVWMIFHGKILGKPYQDGGLPSNYLILVGNLERVWIIFPFSWEFLSSQLTNFIIFQRGRAQPPTSHFSMTYFPFHIWDNSNPIDELIFFKMVIAPPTRCQIECQKECQIIRMSDKMSEYTSECPK